MFKLRILSKEFEKFNYSNDYYCNILHLINFYLELKDKYS